MQLRRPLLAFSLIATIVTVVAGGAGMIFGNEHYLDELVGTVVTLGFLWAVVFGVSFLIDRPALRKGAIVTLGLAVIVAGEILYGIWGRHLGATYYRYRVGNMIGATLFLGLPAAGLLFLESFRPLRLPVRSYAVTAASTLAAVVLIHIIVADRFAYRYESVFTAIFGTGLLISASLLGWGNNRVTFVRWIGVAFAFLGGVCAIVNMYEYRLGYNPMYRSHFTEFIWASAWVVSLAAIHVVVLFLVELKPAQAWMRWSTMGLGLLLATIIVVLMYLDFFGHTSTPRSFFRVLIALGFVTIGATIGLLILWRLNRRSELIATAPALTHFSDVDLTCPLCGKRGKIPAGKSACVECGLRFEIKLEEPRCMGCGYLLYRIKSPNCPECGLPIAGNEDGAVLPSPAHAFPVSPVRPIQPPAQVPPPPASGAV